MIARTTTRKLLVSLLMLATAVWAEAGLALAEGDQAAQCSMSAHEMQAMAGVPCCPDEEMASPAMALERPPCCAVSNAPERPLAVVVSSKRVTAQQWQAVAKALPSVILPMAQSRGERLSADAPRFVRPVLALKTDLRI